MKNTRHYECSNEEEYFSEAEQLEEGKSNASDSSVSDSEHLFIDLAWTNCNLFCPKIISIPKILALLKILSIKVTDTNTYFQFYDDEQPTSKRKLWQ